MVNGGLLVNKNTREYLRAIQTICKNYNMIFILDENQTFGWFPTLFASKYWDIDPDIITLGKGLSGGNPLAGVIIKDYLDGVLDYNEADFTNGGNPLCCAATIATINTLLNTNFKIMEKEKIFTEGFSVIKEKFSNVNVRGIGIIWCLDLSDIESDNNLTSSIYKVMLDRGIFLRQYGNKLIFKPPVIVTEEEIRMVMLKLRKVMEEVLCN
jgi:4-aminobutyrate aminotransferase-like enzyme